MFAAKSSRVEPNGAWSLKPVAGRRANWWAARPSGPGVAGLRNQLVCCEAGPSDESSFEDKYRLSVEFWRAWLLPLQRRSPALQELTIMLQLTFRSDGATTHLVAESLYPLIALYTVLREQPRAAAVRRVTIQVTRYHWVLWKPLMSLCEKAIKLPLENIVGDATDPMLGLQEEWKDEYMRSKPLIDGCQWVLPACLKAVLRNFTRWMGITDSRLLSWFGSSLDDLRDGFII